MTKAIAAGASTVMIGSLLAGTDESPGATVVRDGRRVKGVEAVVPARGPAKDLVYQMVGGLRSGLSYAGATTIKELWQNAEFVRITSAGKHESGVHGVTQTF